MAKNKISVKLLNKGGVVLIESQNVTTVKAEGKIHYVEFSTELTPKGK